MTSVLPAPPAPPALETRALVKRYGRRPPALRGVDLAIRRGGIVALVGPNGAGKSTLIKIWAGLERPTRGHAAVFGVDTWHRRRRAVAQVAYVPQTPALYRQLLVSEHLEMARSMRADFDRAYATALLAELGVPVTAPAGDLSGGQRAQLGLALALATRAPVLLLDEPLASLDPVARREFLQVLRGAVAREGSTCILSSHLVTDIEEACDRLVVLAAGSKLLDEALSAALERHGVSEAGVGPSKAGGATLVASFTGSDRSRRMLWRLATGRLDPGLRRASLDEVVVGYLTLARQSEGRR